MLGALPFFHANLDARVETAIELALIYKVSPFEFVNLSAGALSELYRRTNATLEKLRPEQEE